MKVRNWSAFQHYKHRNPIWIKLHRRLLDDATFAALPVASRALAPLVWLLASESEEDGELPSIKDMAWRVRMSVSDFLEAFQPLVDAGFVQDASDALAECEPVAIPRREEKRREDLPVQTLTAPDLPAGKEPPATPARRDDDGGRVIESTPEPTDVDSARAELVAAIKTAKERRPELAGLSRQEILDRPEYHAPTGRVRLDSPNARLLLVTAAKLRGEVKARKATAPGWDLPPEDAEAKAKADSARAWIADHWPEDSDPQTWEDVLSLAKILEPPAEIAESVTAVLRFERYPDVYHRDQLKEIVR